MLEALEAKQLPLATQIRVAGMGADSAEQVIEQVRIATVAPVVGELQI
jgi:hypothetical protein